MNEVPRELISRREYARRKGVAPSHVMNLCQSGRVSVFCECPGCGAVVNIRVQACTCGTAIAGAMDFGKGKVDPAIADAELLAHADPAKDYMRERWAEQRGAEVMLQLPLAAPAPPPAGTVLSYADAKTLKENLALKSAEIEYRKRAGELCEVSAVHGAAAKAMRQIRDSVLAVPDRLAQVLAAESDRARIHAMLADELEKVLTELSDGNEGIRRNE